jgi:hypothetical protein
MAILEGGAMFSSLSSNLIVTEFAYEIAAVSSRYFKCLLPGSLLRAGECLLSDELLDAGQRHKVRQNHLSFHFGTRRVYATPTRTVLPFRQHTALRRCDTLFRGNIDRRNDVFAR